MGIKEFGDITYPASLQHRSRPMVFSILLLRTMLIYLLVLSVRVSHSHLWLSGGGGREMNFQEVGEEWLMSSRKADSRDRHLGADLFKRVCSLVYMHTLSNQLRSYWVTIQWIRMARNPHYVMVWGEGSTSRHYVCRQRGRMQATAWALVPN